MAKGVNKVILIGNVGNDPDVKHMPSGSAACRLSLATSETWKDKQSGESQERTEWHSLVFYGRLAEIAGEYLKKGSKVYVEGRLQTRKWQDKQTGGDRYTTEIIVSDMQMLDGRGGGASSADYGDNAGYKRGGGGGGDARGSSSSAPMERMDDFEDDIPF